jgi:dolichyl-phosphate beta-glucosyltransferase
VTDRAYRFVLVALVPSLVDIGLLVGLRHGLGWMLLMADLAAIGVASIVSYVLHRVVTFRSDPYVRWVNVPWAFVAIAAVAAAVDVTILLVLSAASGYDTVTGLVVAKLVALTGAAAFRLVAYRGVLMMRFTSGRRTRIDRPPPPGQVRMSLVLPAVDEGDRIGRAVAAYRAGLEAWAEQVTERHDVAPPASPAAEKASTRGVEIIVVDDGSTDDTAGAALAAGADQVVVLPSNQGKGAAVRAGMLAARGRTVAFTDADLAYSPGQVARMVAAVEDGWDLAIGDRRHPEAGSRAGATTARAWGSRGVNLLVYLVLLGGFRDTQCGLKACRADVARFVFSRARVDGFAFDIELLHLAERHGFSVAELPVHVDHSTRSTVRPVRSVLRLVADIGRIRHWSATGVYESGPDVDPGEGLVDCDRVELSESD